eukprot:998810-Amorphochlora_amoeboformis.AAC.3
MVRVRIDILESASEERLHRPEVEIPRGRQCRVHAKVGLRSPSPLPISFGEDVLIREGEMRYLFLFGSHRIFSIVGGEIFVPLHAPEVQDGDVKWVFSSV